MLPQWIIKRKRDGRELSEAEINFFIEGYTNESIPDCQMAALAMAICCRGMTPAETAHLTKAMMSSGRVIDPGDIPGHGVDKHSTGGIGDKISLCLAPLVAAAGGTVPMISGRGLGITGGTLDKLESIPGYRTALTRKEFLHTLETCGCSIISQTTELVPADKKLYSLRNITGTIPSIPLIVSSIMSKKLAEGIDGLVLDVKCGSGTFMNTLDDARSLAQALVDTGATMGRKVTALITDMNQPLGRAVGNALEVREAVEILSGSGPADVRELTVELSAHMLVLGGLFPDLGKAREKCFQCLENGLALERWRQMVACHGGDPDAELPESENQISLPAPISGTVVAVDAEAIGRASLLLGAGRTGTIDRINPAVGLSNLRKIGESVGAGEPLCVIHASKDWKNREEIFRALENAFQLSETPVNPPPLVREIISQQPL